MSLDAFFVQEVDPYSDAVCAETRRRIRLTIAAYAYEILQRPIMSDGEFDELAKAVDLSIDTRRPDLDKWFRKNFDPFTGMWIHGHPERARVEKLAWLCTNSLENAREERDEA
jgi:hypothetical protein